MADKHIICFLISILLVRGLKREGPKWDIMLPLSYKEPCVSILATDLAPYQGKFYSMQICMPQFFTVFFRYRKIYFEESKFKRFAKNDGESTVSISNGFSIMPGYHCDNRWQWGGVKTDWNQPRTVSVLSPRAISGICEIARSVIL